MRAKLLVGFVTARETAPCKDAAGVRIDHEHRAVKRVKQDVVRGFGADALDAQETLAQSLGSPAPQARVTACIDIPCAEIAEALRLHEEVTGGPPPLLALRGGAAWRASDFSSVRPCAARERVPGFVSARADRPCGRAFDLVSVASGRARARDRVFARSSARSGRSCIRTFGFAPVRA